MNIYDSIYDSIYEAAVVPELWPQTLDRIAEFSETKGGILFTVAPAPGVAPGMPGTMVPRWVSSAVFRERFNDFVEAGWNERNLRLQRGVRLQHAGFLNDYDLVSPEEIATDPMYAYFRTVGFGWFAGVAINPPSGDSLVFNWERPTVDGPVSRDMLDRLDPLRPHLARAAQIASRIGLEKALAATEALAAMGLPAAVVSTGYRLMAANDLLRALIPSVIEERAFGRFRLVHAPADALLSSALAAAPRNLAGVGGASQVMSIPIPSKEDRPAMIVHLAPLRRAGFDIFTGAMALLYVTPVAPTAVPNATVLQGLFDLTAAEARVARAIAEGGTIKTIAAGAGKSKETVRFQLKAIFAKTGVSRQAELTGLLSGIDPFRKG